MGKMNIIQEVEKIFSKPSNFDITGFAHSELVTPEIAEALGHLSYDEWSDLIDLGYEFYWFSEAQDDGIISKWFKGNHLGTSYSLRLYFNQQYPKEIAKGVNEGGQYDRPGESDSAD